MTHPFRAAVESRDLEAMSAALAPDVVFWSPVAFAPYRSRVVVGEVLANVLEVFEDFAYVDDLAGDGSHALIFTAKVAGREVQGLDHFRANSAGQITDFTVMVRPLSGAIALAEAMGPRVEHLPKG